MIKLQSSNLKIFMTLGFRLDLNPLGQPYMNKYLTERLDYTYQIYQQSNEQSIKNNVQTLFLVSGRGQNGVEAKLMGKYLIQKYNLSKDMIIQENKSMITLENYIFSYYYLWKMLVRKQSAVQSIDVHVVTSDFHKERAKIIHENIQPSLNKAFKDIKLNQPSFYGANSNQPKEIINDQYIQTQLQRYKDPQMNWKQFAKDRDFDEIDQDLINQFKNYLTN